jgi:hypothetical protein
MASFCVSAAPAVKAPAAPVRLARSAAPASVARRSVRMQASYKVTLVTPEGTKEITCADDVYVLDAAEVRHRSPGAPAGREQGPGPGWACVRATPLPGPCRAAH